jgi:PST family polysaccharide transporter
MSKVQQDIERLGLAFRYSISLYALVLLPFSAITTVLAAEIVRVLLGPSWTAVVAPFQLLVLGMLFRAGNRTNNSLAHATGAVYNRSWRQAIFAGSILGGAWFGSRWGVSGVAFFTLIAFIMNYLLMAQLGLTLINMRWKSFFTAHIPGLLLAGITFIISWPAATILRNLGLPAIGVLIISCILTGASLFFLVYLKPQLLLGQDGVWMLGVLTGYARRKLARFNRVKKVST